MAGNSIMFRVVVVIFGGAGDPASQRERLWSIAAPAEKLELHWRWKESDSRQTFVNHRLYTKTFDFVFRKAFTLLSRVPSGETYLL